MIFWDVLCVAFQWVSNRDDGTVQHKTEGLRKTCVLTSLIKQHIENNSDLGFFAGILQKIQIFFIDLGSLVSQDTECIHVNQSPFVTRGHKSQDHNM